MNRRLFRKLLGLSRAEWADLVRAQTALVRTQLVVRTRPLGQLLVSAQPALPTATVSVPVSAAVQRLARAVERVAAHGLFRPTCLVQAIALQGMLRARGFGGGSVRVGVRWQDGRFLAHAWVNYRGVVLADHASRVSAFDELPCLDEARTS
jgi:Transglutaminase-like superfamily